MAIVKPIRAFALVVFAISVLLLVKLLSGPSIHLPLPGSFNAPIRPGADGPDPQLKSEWSLESGPTTR